MKNIKINFFLLLLFFFVATKAMALIVNYKDIPGVTNLPPLVISAIATQKWLFLHASVGGDIVDPSDDIANPQGMLQLYNSNSDYYKLNINIWGYGGSGATKHANQAPASTVPGTFYACKAMRTINGRADHKAACISNSVTEYGWNFENADKVHIVAGKLGYNEDDPADGCGEYIPTITNLENEYPETIIAYVAMTPRISGNSDRQILNDSIRSHVNNLPRSRLMIDLSSILSHGTNNEAYADSGNENLCPYYTTDGGHLRDDDGYGSRQGAWAMYASAAAISGHRRICFSISSNSVAESAGSISITVDCDSLRVHPAASVHYSTIDGSATAGQDYTATSGTLTWNANEHGSKTFSVPILSDSFADPDEYFSVKLTYGNNSYLIFPWQTTINIQDSDPTDFPEINVRQGVTDLPDSSGSYDFGAINIGSDASSTFTIQNTGTGPLSINDISISGSEFTITDSPDSPVVAGNSTTFDVQFTPAAVGTVDETVTILNNDNDEATYTFSINGEGVGNTPEMIVLIDSTEVVDNTSADFGDVELASSSSIVFTVQNTGNQILNLNGTPKVVITGDNAADFSVDTFPISPIASAGSTTFKITFSPSDGGQRLAELSISNDDLNENPYNFTLQGNGIAPEIYLYDDQANNLPLGGSFSFGNVALSSTKTLTFGFENRGVGMNLNLTGSPYVQISGDSQFSISDQPDADFLEPSRSTTFDVQFIPNSVDNFTATVSISNNDADENPYIFYINGEGINSSTIDVRVESATDDAEQREDNGVANNSSDLELVRDNSGSRGEQIVGIRFQNISVPDNANVNNAYIQFTSEETSSEDTSVTIWGEDVANPLTFQNSNNNIGSRTKTTASVYWSIPEWSTINEAGSNQQTPDLSDIINEILDNSGQNDNMVFIISGTGRRVAESYDGNSAAAPLLHIEYSNIPEPTLILVLFWGPLILKKRFF